MKTHVVLIALISAAPACSKSQDTKSQPEKQKHVASPDFGGEFPDFDLVALAKKLEGKTYLIQASFGPEVWSFAGDKVTIDDGKDQVIADVKVDSPCSMKVLLPEHDGIQRNRDQSFAWNGDTLYLGGGYGGARHGDTYVACYGIDSYVLQDGVCEIGGPPGRISWHPATCSVHGDQLVTDKLRYTIIGDALVDPTLQTHVAERVPSLAAGKAKLATR